MQPAINLQAQATHSLLNVMSTFTQLRKAAQTLSSDVHRQQEGANSRLSEACRRFREIEAEAPSRINPAFSRGEPFRQPKSFSSGLFLRQTAPVEVNAFRAQAEEQPNLRSLEQFRSFLMNAPKKFTISKPEYFLDCWLEEEESRQKREYQRKQTKRRREEKVVVPPVFLKRTNEHGEATKLMVGQEVVLEPSSLTPSLEDYLERLDMESLPPVPQHSVVPTTAAKGLPPKLPASHASSLPSSGLPKPKRVKVMVPPFVAPNSVQATIVFEPVVHAQPSPLHQQIISSAGIAALRPLTNVNVSAVEVSPEQTEAPPRRTPLSFREQITNGPGIEGLRPVQQIPKETRDYRPAFFKEIENHSGLNPVHRPTRVVEETNALFDALFEIRKRVEVDKPIQKAGSESTWSSEMSN